MCAKATLAHCVRYLRAICLPPSPWFGTKMGIGRWSETVRWVNLAHQDDVRFRRASRQTPCNADDIVHKVEAVAGRYRLSFSEQLPHVSSAPPCAPCDIRAKRISTPLKCGLSDGSGRSPLRRHRAQAWHLRQGGNGGAVLPAPRRASTFARDEGAAAVGGTRRRLRRLSLPGERNRSVFEASQRHPGGGGGAGRVA